MELVQTAFVGFLQLILGAREADGSLSLFRSKTIVPVSNECWFSISLSLDTLKMARMARSKQPVVPIEDWRRADGDPELAHVEVVNGCNQGYQRTDIERCPPMKRNAHAFHHASLRPMCIPSVRFDTCHDPTVLSEFLDRRGRK